MNCQLCEELLQQRLDGTVIDTAAVALHLRECPACRAAEASVRLLEQGLRHWTAPVPPANLASIVVARVQADRRARRGRWLAAGLAVAAAVLTAIGLGLIGSPSSIPPNGPAPPPLADNDNVAPAAPIAVRETVAEAGSAVVALTSRTAGEARDQARVLLPVMTGAVPEELDLANPMISTPASLTDAGQGLKSSLEPVAASARRAVGLFLRDLSGVEPDAKPGL